jgi:hypothetical protein
MTTEQHIAILEIELKIAEAEREWYRWDDIQTMIYNLRSFGRVEGPIFVYDENGIRIGYKTADGCFVEYTGMTYFDM